jgi:hypothetical protein
VRPDTGYLVRPDTGYPAGLLAQNSNGFLNVKHRKELEVTKVSFSNLSTKHIDVFKELTINYMFLYLRIRKAISSN